MEIANSKSVLSTTFHLGTFQMPVRLYKTTSLMGLSGHLYHDGCGGKIRQWKTCEEHPNTNDPATFSGLFVGNKLVRLTPEIKDQLFDGESEFKTVSAHKLSGLSALISEQYVSFLEPLEMTPEKFFDSHMSTLLNRLRIRKQFLLAKFSRNHMRRFGILLPSGLFIPILYREEVRDRKFSPSDNDRQVASEINEQLDRLSTDGFNMPSCSDMTDRMQRWFTDIALGRNIVAYQTTIVEKVDA